MENKNNKFLKVSTLIHLYCFKEDLIDKCKENEPVESSFLFIKKTILNKYKSNLKYNEFLSNLKPKNILDCIKENGKIKYEKLKSDDNISKIIKSLKKNIVEKIEKINIDKIINEIKTEDNEWEYIIPQYLNKNDNIRLIKDLEIISRDILELLMEQKINLKNVLLGKCVLGWNKVFFFFTLYNKYEFYEIGSFTNQDFKIEYVFDENQLESSYNIIEYMKKNNIYENLNQFKRIIPINIGKNSINCYKVEENKLITNEEHIFSMLDKKIKGLVLLSIYQLKCFLNNITDEEKVVLINKKIFDKFFLSEMNKMITKNKNILNFIYDIDLKNLTININKIICQLNFMKLKHISDKISKIEDNDVPSEPEFKELKLSNSKIINIYNNFIIMNQKLFNEYLCFDFKIKLKQSNISFITINNKAIIKINYKKQMAIFIGNINHSENSYLFEKILCFDKSKDLNNEFKELKNIGIDFYLKNRVSNDSIFANGKNIGSVYNFPRIIKDDDEKNNYINYKILNANISLYLFYEQIKEKLKANNNINPEKYYLISEKFLTEIKNQSKYNLLKEDLKKDKIDINNCFNENKDFNNITKSFLKKCSSNTVQKYSNIKLNIEYENNLIKEIDYISLDYYDYKEKKNISIIVYNNFGIIDKKIIELFIEKEYDKNKLVECFFNSGYIIINMPNNLNKKYISLLGSFDFDNNIFKLEYFMVYNKEKYRSEHIQHIISIQINNYIKNLNLINNFSQIEIPNEKKSIGTIAKYGNDQKNIINNIIEVKDKNESNNQINLNNNNQVIINSDKENNNQINSYKENNNQVIVNSVKESNNQINSDKENNNQVIINSVKENNNQINSYKENNDRVIVKSVKENNYKINSDKENNDRVIVKSVKENNNQINSYKENNNQIIINSDKQNNNQINSDKENNDLIIMNSYKENNNQIIINSDKENSNQIKSKITKIEYNDLKEEFNICPSVGLQNIGATCYMNATLQCFCHIKNLIEFFKYKFIPSMINNNEDNLSSSFKLLIDNLWPDNYNEVLNKYYAPYEFKDKISKMNPLFEGIAANDAKDLVNFIIMTLHSELNTKKVSNQYDDYGMIDQTNKELVYDSFIKDYINSNSSIISELFYAHNYSISECTNCHKKTYNYQIYFFMIFYLEEVRKYKILMDNNINNELNIYDCFDYDGRLNFLTGESSMYCNYCGENCDFTMETKLAGCPKILILLLNRGQGNKFDVKINFEKIINLNKYIENTNTDCNYELIGVITHIGESSMSGHFIAYCKDPLSNNWHKYNDAFVDEVKNFEEEVINYAMPYLLFYQKM